MSWLPERRFWLLRRLCKVLSGIGWIALGLTILVTPVGIARAIVGGSHDEIWDWIKYGASGGLFFLYVVFLAQSIEVILAVEENTKHAGYVLEKLTTLTQQVRDRLGEIAEGRQEAAGSEQEEAAPKS
jgi:uncharacterized membrane protein